MLDSASQREKKFHNRIKTENKKKKGAFTAYRAIFKWINSRHHDSHIVVAGTLWTREMLQVGVVTCSSNCFSPYFTIVH